MVKLFSASRACFRGASFAAVAAMAVAAEPQGRDPVADLVVRLGAPQFASREAAARGLVEAGRPALGPLEAACDGDDLEVASRAVEIIGMLLAGGDAEQSTDAERVLDRLASRPDSPVSRLAESVLDFHVAGMASAARDALEARGAVFRDRRPEGGLAGLEVEFNASWRGSGDEWRQLTRLRGLACVSVHGVALDDASLAALGRLRGVRRIDLFGTQVGPEATAALASRLPDALIDVRKGGKLGVSSFGPAGPCEISGVQPGSAADRAGLRAGDVVVAVNGEPLDSFRDLTAWVARRDSGEEVRLEFVRPSVTGGSERKVCTVRLDAW